MEQSLIQRINELARKAKVQELSEEEKQEQTQLRNLTDQLEHTYIMDENGNKRKLGK